MELKETQTILDLVLQNVGVTILPKMALNIAPMDLRLLEITPKIYRTIYLIQNPNKKFSSVIKNIISYIELKVNH